MRNLLAVALLALIAPPAHATTFSIDLTDLWWDPAESGWGVNVVQQQDVLFLTFHLYSSTGAPIWYSASEMHYAYNLALDAPSLNLPVGALPAGATPAFTGALYQTSGPATGGSYDASRVQYRRVGNVFFALQFTGSATLDYTIDGVAVQKSLKRATWRANDLSGAYIGGSLVTSSCGPVGPSTYAEDIGLVAVSHKGADITISTQTCQFTGTYTQTGHTGSITGSYTCTNAAPGTFTAFDVQASQQSFSAWVTGQSTCDWQGLVGGLRRGPASFW